MADKKFNPTVLEEGLGAVAIAACLVASPLLRPWYHKWGATEAEVKMSLPGDDMVPYPRLDTTRAITIQAPAAEVWPWLVQIGQGRGGLYSYERLENLVGCDMHNADRVLPEHQDLQVGDQVHFSATEGAPAFDVAAIEPGRALILRGGDAADTQATPTIWIWIFYLHPIDEKSTRLIIRSRLTYEPNFGNTLMWRVFTDPISFMMERKLLQGVKARAESDFR